VRLFGLLACAAIGCGPGQAPGNFVPAAPESIEAQPAPPSDPGTAGVMVDRMVDFAFDGGQLEFELRRNGDHVVQIARNRYAVPMMVQWEATALTNLEPTSPVAGVVLLPAASAPLGAGRPIVIAEFQIIDPGERYRRELYFHSRFGDPRARASRYIYGLPYPSGDTFTILQGFHGAFSHHGSDEYAIDFQCPVATPVVAARPGLVIAANASAQGAGTTQEFLEYRRVNFVMVLHDDGTIGAYMHLAPSGVEVKPGQRVVRGQELALSGNTGFSTTAHLHFAVMTAGEDGVSARSFPFQLAIAPGKVGEPVEGRSYKAWE
jgi:murein DD-endopeptidase MepM/ murein hydrolase activator NlpD